MPTSIGLAMASAHTGGRHVCIVPDERSRSEYAKGMSEAGVYQPEIVVGEAEEEIDNLTGIDFLVVDCKRKDFSRVFREAKLSSKGGVLVCKNANSRTASRFIWRSVVEEGSSSRRVVRSVFLPVGKGLDIAHVSAVGGSSALGLSGGGAGKRWIKHFDQRSGELHVIRR